MAFQSIPQSSFAGGLGRGVGQGLSEQLPKEIERIRLSEGLKNLGTDTSNLSPLEQVSKLAAIPGMNMQNIGAFLPYLQQLQGRQALAQKAGEQKKPGAMAQEGERSSKRGSFRERMESQDFATPRNDQQIYQRANELAQLNPNITEQEAIAQANAEDQKRVSFDQSLQAKRGLIRDEFNAATNAFLQKEGKEKYGDIIGEMQQEYLDKADQRAFDENISPYTAAKEASKDLLNFAKTRQGIKTNRSAIFFGGKSGDKVLKDIKNARNEYADRGQLELFRNDLINYHNLTPETADSLAYPESKNVKSTIGELPRTHREKTKGFGQSQVLTDRQVKEISEKMGKDDSPRTIALALKKRGYDADEFLEQLKNYSKDFNERQKRDLTSLSDRHSLGDIQLFGFKGLPEIGRK